MKENSLLNNLKYYALVCITIVFLHILFLSISTSITTFIFGNIKDSGEWIYQNEWLIISLSKLLSIIGIYYYLRILTYSHIPMTTKKFLLTYLPYAHNLRSRGLRKTFLLGIDNALTPGYLAFFIYLSLFSWASVLLFSHDLTARSLFDFFTPSLFTSPLASSSKNLIPLILEERSPLSQVISYIVTLFIFYGSDIWILSKIKELCPLSTLLLRLAATLTTTLLFAITLPMIVPHPRGDNFYFWITMHFCTLSLLLNLAARPSKMAISLYLILIVLPCDLVMNFSILPSTLSVDFDNLLPAATTTPSLLFNYKGSLPSNELWSHFTSDMKLILQQFFPQKNALPYLLFWLFAYIYLIIKLSPLIRASRHEEDFV
ncbi:MAG: hypothetical protein HQK52_06400 [Oligoflexia bacterium]|nr:hypothetical protein [Oligoflexia bacterium]